MSITLEDMSAELTEIKRMVKSLLEQKEVKQYYTPREFAELNSLNADYVREMCRKGRIDCKRTHSGRGNKREIRIPHSEMLRHQAEGLRQQSVDGPVN